MKSIYKYSSALGIVAVASLSGCYEMDTYPMSQYLTEEQKTEVKEANPDMAQAGITGITGLFSTFCKTFAPDEEHDDFGFPSIMLASDSRGIDLIGVNDGYNHFLPSTAMADCDPSGAATAICWSNCYKQIFAANAALKSIDPTTDDPTLMFYMAQSKAMRAYDYLILAQTYQFTYVGNEDKPCVMIVTEDNEEEFAANGAGRATVKAVYEQIMSDLNSAVELLVACGVKPSDVLTSKPKRFVSLAAAYGLRARANLIMNKWQEAASDASDAITNFAGQPSSLDVAAAPGFTSLDESNWMWGIAIAPTDRVVTSQIINFPSHMGSLNYGYASVGAWRSVNKKLYDYIPATDVRKGWFLDEESKSVNLTDEQQAYVDDKKIPPYVQVKFGPYLGELGTTVNACDIPLMRVEEMYYIKAEATAMAGGDGATVLNQFVKAYRNPAYSFTGVGTDVQNECWMQRRVEFYGEGLTTFDLMRLNKDFDRTGGGWAQVFNYNVPANSPVLLLCIPESEQNGNKAFSAAQNNSPAPRPTVVVE
ncbi:MAG: RagB/SusD family nutrient uptake outer membrane protein [Bacteroides sp.]|nr:RagB/SusD family nutrient uptake outer membrane protein [Bacteroides sp.]MCM1379508.1 RagB/SusD family nutrient uptake outer membrane protein [Bacteroides sp.]MCM1445889.1 RagB/SusD family nutrient uptake outer membrane protein [Prevotella sp.]